MLLSLCTWAWKKYFLHVCLKWKFDHSIVSNTKQTFWQVIITAYSVFNWMSSYFQSFGLEYERYLREVVMALEEDESFRKKLEEANMTDIKVRNSWQANRNWLIPMVLSIPLKGFGFSQQNFFALISFSQKSHSLLVWYFFIE